MTATITQVRRALAARLGSIDGLAAHAFAPGTINPPAAVVEVGDGEFLTYDTSHNSHDLLLVVGVFIQRGELQSAYEQLDGFLADDGAFSVYAAVEADPKLGGTVDSAVVLSARNYGSFSYNSIDYIGCEFPVAVLL